VFGILSVATLAGLALWSHSPALWVIVALLAVGQRSRWQAARLQAAWREGLPRELQLRSLFVALEKLRVTSFTRRWTLVRAAFTQRTLLKPRIWESLLTVSLLTPVWIGVTALAFQIWAPRHSVATRDTRTTAQRAFDDAMDDADEDDGNSEALGVLRQRAAALDAADPRRIDLQVVEALAAPEPERRQQVEDILTAGKGGLRWPLDAVVRSELYELGGLSSNYLKMPAVERAQRLRAGIGWSERVAPALVASTIDARLRLAEAIDDGGDSAGASTMLAEIGRLADSCRCERRRVARAQAWFYLSHGESDKALRLLQPEALDSVATSPGSTGGVDYAWSLLLSGRTEEGLQQMHMAAYRQAPRANGLLGLLQGPAVRARLSEPMDLAFALRAASRLEEARAVAASPAAKWQCELLRSGTLYEYRAPWQRERDRLLAEAAREVCPAQTAR